MGASSKTNSTPSRGGPPIPSRPSGSRGARQRQPLQVQEDAARTRRVRRARRYGRSRFDEASRQGPRRRKQTLLITLTTLSSVLPSSFTPDLDAADVISNSMLLSFSLLKNKHL